MSANIEQAMRATTEALLHSFEGQWKAGATLDLRAPGCEHVVLPASLGVPKRSNKDFERYFEQIAPHVGEAVMTMNDYLAVPAERKVVCRSSMKAMTKVGPFNNEYIWWLTFDERGEKLVQITEFMDGTAAKPLLARLREEGHLTGGH